MYMFFFIISKLVFSLLSLAHVVPREVRVCRTQIGQVTCV